MGAILSGMAASDFQLDALPRNVAEPLIWLQYHCRQMELLDTWPGLAQRASAASSFLDSLRFFLILRKKFDDISFFHMYWRVLNMWLGAGTCFL